MESKNPIIRLVFFGKMKKMITSYQNTKIQDIDRRLFRGLFMRNLKDFDEDYKEKIQNKSLMMRLKAAMLTTAGGAEISPRNATEYEANEQNIDEINPGLRNGYYNN